MAEGESAAVIGPTRLPASRVASPYRCNRCEPESLVEPSTTPSSSLSIPVSRLIDDGRRENVQRLLMSLNMLIEFGDAFDCTGADFKGWCSEVGVHAV